MCVFVNATPPLYVYVGIFTSTLSINVYIHTFSPSTCAADIHILHVDVVCIGTHTLRHNLYTLIDREGVDILTDR